MSTLFQTRSDGPFGRKNRIDRTDLFWLAYLVFFVIEPIGRRSLHYWLENLAFLVAFLALYLTFLRRSESKRVQLSLIAGMALLGVLSMPLNGGAAAFMIYAAALLPFVLPSAPWLFAALFCDALLLLGEEWWLHFSPFQIFINVFFTIVVGGTNFHFAQKARADCKLRMQQEEIETLAAVAERERIARDLHDVLGHTLSVIVLKAELAGRLLERELATTRATNLSSRPEGAARSGETPVFDSASAEGASLPQADLARARAEIGDVERTARTALGEVREAIGGYRARGLRAEIDTARQTLATAGVSLTTEGDLQPATLTAAEETVLALALREAVTNIVRHAEATTCRLRLVLEHGRHRLSIEDNGRHPDTREGNGLRGMRERVESLGGQLSLTREGGTHLLIELPQRAGATT